MHERADLAHAADAKRHVYSSERVPSDQTENEVMEHVVAGLNR